VRLWNLAKKPVQPTELAGFRDDVNAIAFSPDGKAIAGAGNEGVMRLWDASGKELKVWKEAIYQNQNVQDIAFSPNGKFIVVGGLVSIARVWNREGSLTEPQAKLKGMEGSQDGHQGNIASVAVSPDSQLIATGSYDKTMRVWKPKSPNGELVAVAPKQEGVISRVVFTANSQQIVTADWEGNIAFWDLAGKQINKWEKVHQTQIRGLGITRDGSRIVTADKSSYVKILDSSGKQLREFFSYQSGINELVISPDGQLIATGGMDGTLRLWDFQGRQVAEFRNPKGAIWGVAFSPDSQQIALAGDKGFASVRTIESPSSLMDRSCEWLRDYLESHPAEKAALNCP
jgi:WD40 repeat protein